jgi:hypothetical protein
MTKVKTIEAVAEKCSIVGTFAAGNYAQKYVTSSVCFLLIRLSRFYIFELTYEIMNFVDNW